MTYIYAGLYGPEALIDPLGNAEPVAAVTVLLAGTATKATVYSSNVRAALANPLPTSVAPGSLGSGVDVFGNLSFYAEPGVYDLSVTAGGQTRLVRVGVNIDPAEVTAGGGGGGVAGVASFNTRTGPVTLAKSDVTGTGLAKADLGLGNVDNTADAAKPVSTAQATADTAVQTAAAADVTSRAALKANNLSDLANAATARTNLGLGSAATQSSTAFDAAGAATAVQTNLTAEVARAQNAEAAISNGLKNTQAAVVATTNQALSGLPTVDGVTLADGQVPLLTGQTAGSQNGLWVVHSGAWTRPANFAAGSDATGTSCWVESGTVNGSSSWVVTGTTNNVIGTNVLTWQQVSGLGEVTVTADLTKTGNQLGLAATAVTPGSYTAANVTVDGKGRITAASSGASVASAVTVTPTGGISSTDVQSALAELDTKKVATTDPRLGIVVAQSLWGANNKPWKPAPFLGPELWTLANFQAGYNTTVLAPTLTANSTNQSVRTRINLGNLANHDTAFRLALNISSAPTTPAAGWFSVSALLTDTGGTILAGTAEQFFAIGGDPVGTVPGQRLIEFQPSVPGGCYLEVKVAVYNNLASGTLSINNVSLREIAHVTRPLQFATIPSFGTTVFQTVWDPVVGAYKMVSTLFAADGALTTALVNIKAAATTQPFQYPVFDPAFVNTGMGVTSPTTGSVTGTLRSLRSQNNDQVIEVLGSDGVTWTLRCNTHGGETNTSPVVYESDLDGSGASWVTWDGTGARLQPAARFRFTYDTTVARPAPDSDNFATVHHVATFFPDGIMRMDRTTTFIKSVTIRAMFDWMSSHDVTVPKIGRIGRGLIVIDEVDTFPKVAVPATPTAATATTGGTLAAATYTYAVTALSEGGETTASATVAQTTTGTTSTVTVTWVAVTSATGYRVYGRVAGRLVLLATLGAAATSWVDDGSLPSAGAASPIVNTGRLLQSTTIASDATNSSNAYWTCWYDPVAGIAFANIYDRDALAARTGVAAVKTRLEGVTSTIQKAYINAYWGSSDRYVVPNGAVWPVTHWCYTYIPQDRTNYHLETALLASDLTNLKLAYPAA